MFNNRDIPYSSRNDPFDSALSPVSALCSLGSPWDLSTPGRDSSSSMEPDEMAFGTPYSNSPGVQDDFFVTEGSNSGMPVFLDQNLMFPCNDGKTLSDQSMMGYSTLTNFDDSTYDSYDVQTGIPNSQPGLEIDMYTHMASLGSPAMSMGFVVPSQTTFANAYEVNSSLRELKPLPIRSAGPNSAHDSGMNQSGPNDKFRIMQSQTPRSYPAQRLRPSPTRTPAFESMQTGPRLSESQTENFSRRQRTRRGNSSLPTVPSHVRVQNKAIKKCTFPGCNGRFQRQEHLKRHEKTHGNAESFVCQFCQKAFGRSDNLKSHTKLHTKKTARTEFYPEAQVVWEEMSRKPRKVRDVIKCKL